MGNRKHKKTHKKKHTKKHKKNHNKTRKFSSEDNEIQKQYVSMTKRSQKVHITKHQ